MEISERQFIGPSTVGPDLEDGAISDSQGSPLVVHRTPEFETDLNRLSVPDRALVVDEINARAGLILGDRETFEAKLSRPFVPSLPNGLDSTLWVMSLEGDHRVIFTLDHDPMFGETSMILLRVVPPTDEESAFRWMASLLYDGL